MTSASPTIFLDENEAAIRLGITKELLFSYVSHAPKKHSGESRKLGIIQKNQTCYFSEWELDQWVEYLQEPWSESGLKRPPIPSYVQQYLKTECGGQCALCGYGHKLENAHIVEYEKSLSHYHHNLIRLCTDCHSKYDEKIIPAAEILYVKSLLIQKVQENIRSKNKQFVQSSTIHRLPAPKPLFVGRDVELKILKAALVEERVVVIEGIGGIGKSQLALQALKADEMSAIWIDMESVQDFSDFQTMLSTRLLSEGILAASAKTVFEILDDKPLRIVLDGTDRLSLDDQERLIDFLQDFLRLTRSPKILITTQIEFQSPGLGIRKMKLQSLSLQDSRLILLLGTQELMVDSDNAVITKESDIEWLADFCEGHPLSLQIVVGLIIYYKKSAIVTKRLEEQGAGEMKSPIRQEQKRTTSLEVCLLAAYSCFNHAQKRLLLYFSCFPAGCLEHKADHWDYEEQGDDFYKDLAELRRFFFVEAQPDKIYVTTRYFLLNPVKEFVRKQWREDALEESSAIQMLAAEESVVEASIIRHDFLESPNFSEVQIGLSRIDFEFPNYIAAIEFAMHESIPRLERDENVDSYHRIVAFLSSALSKYFFVRGVFESGIKFLRIGTMAHETLGQFDFAATDYVMLASLQYRIFDYAGHWQTTQKLLELADKTGDKRINALASMCVGEAADKKGNHYEAVAHLEIAADYFKSALQRKSDSTEPEGETEDFDYYRGMLGIIYLSIGRSYEHLDLPVKSLPFLQKGLEYALETNDYANIGSAYHEIGNCHSMMENPSESVIAYRTAVQYFYRLGYRQFISNALGELGNEVVKAGLDSKTAEILSEEVLRIGLDDVQREVELLAARANRPLVDESGMLRKLFGIIKLVSFTSSAGILQDWAENFGYKVIEPLLEKQYREFYFRDALFVEHLDLIANITYCFGMIIRSSEGLTENNVFRLAKLCYLINQTPSLHSFEWLAAFLRHRGVQPSVTGSLLEEMITRAIENEDQNEFKPF